MKVFIVVFLFGIEFLLNANEIQRPDDLFTLMQEKLLGNWRLSESKDQIDTSSYKHPAVFPLAGTNKIAITFKMIGGDSTLQEDLLPDTAKQMVTMYHCYDMACSKLKATHYCVKQNQPELFANTNESTPNRIVFDCDMSTELCRSNEDHVHQIIHEFSNGNKHLKTSYLSWENQQLKDNSSIYHFEKMDKK